MKCQLLEFIKTAQYTEPALNRINLPWGYKKTAMAEYVYIKDYQGNIRAVTDSKGSVIQSTDYYPYGMPMATSTGAEVNRYKYSGKELETNRGLNFYDFDTRMCDVGAPLFNRPDPLAHKKPDMSPYVLCNSNPINFVDPTGMDTINVRYVDKKWIIDQPIIAEGNDVFIVTKGDKTETYVFDEGEYGNRVCALNLDIGNEMEDLTLGVYHVSGSSEAHGYYMTPGGEASVEEGSNKRIPPGTYSITTPSWKESKWKCIGVGVAVSARGIRFHYGEGVGKALKN